MSKGTLDGKSQLDLKAIKILASIQISCFEFPEYLNSDGYLNQLRCLDIPDYFMSGLLVYLEYASSTDNDIAPPTNMSGGGCNVT